MSQPATVIRVKKEPPYVTSYWKAFVTFLIALNVVGFQLSTGGIVVNARVQSETIDFRTIMLNNFLL